jgi:beta-glucanase (GH16 family)
MKPRCLRKGAANLLGGWALRISVMGLASLLVASSAVPASGAASNSEELDLANYRLTFSENFDRLDISARGPGTRWIAHTPWNGDFGSARFLDPQPGGPFLTAASLLTISMRKSSDGRWTSGLIASAESKGRGFTQSGGYFEMRARLPGGAGVWPAFWLGSVGAAPGGNPEIDVLEYYGHDPASYYVNLHLWKDGKDTYNRHAKVVIPSGLAEGGFHLYGVSLYSDYVTFYMDGKVVARLPSRPEMMTPVLILANLAAGGGWPIQRMPNPSSMQIDYIRSYQRKTAA